MSANSLRRRYLNDVRFHAFVQQLHAYTRNCEFNYEDLRQAVKLVGKIRAGDRWRRDMYHPTPPEAEGGECPTCGDADYYLPMGAGETTKFPCPRCSAEPAEANGADR